jgi:6-phosphogluconolactonase/glucosamine-6-phosphate isomerase/deaminase
MRPDLSSLALETTAPKAPHPRVTLGLGALRACEDLVVVVTGTAKGPVLRRVLDGDRTLPLALVLEGRESTIFVDKACARAAGL